GPVGNADPKEGNVEHGQSRECPCQPVPLGRTPAANGPGSAHGRDPERGKPRIRQSRKNVDESPPLGNRQEEDAEPHGIPSIPARQYGPAEELEVERVERISRQQEISAEPEPGSQQQAEEYQEKGGEGLPGRS